MAKRQTKGVEWFSALIKKVGADTIDGKKLWELADEVNKEFGLSKFPAGSRHTVLERFQRSELVDLVSEGRKMLISIRDSEGLIKFIEGDIKTGGRKKAETKTPVVREERKPKETKVSVSVVLPKVDKTREAFIKYFRCLRYAVRSKSTKVNLKMCMKVNTLPRIQSKHVLYWAKVVKDLGVSITMPNIRKEESDVFVEFLNSSEDLMNVCNFGVKQYPDYVSLKPEEAFGGEKAFIAVCAEIKDKKREVTEPKKETAVVATVKKEEPKVVATNGYHRQLTDLEHGVIFFTAELIRSGGINDSPYTTDLCATVSKRYGLNLSRKEFEDILRNEPEINLTASAGIAKTKLRNPDSYEKIKKAHGYDVQRKYRILAQINMKPEELSSRFSRLSFKVESEIGQFGYIYSIQCSRSKEDLAVLRQLFSIFRGDDKPFTEIGLFNRLMKEAKLVEEMYNNSDRDYLADSEAWREAELIRKH